MLQCGFVKFFHGICLNSLRFLFIKKAACKCKHPALKPACNVDMGNNDKFLEVDLVFPS